MKANQVKASGSDDWLPITRASKYSKSYKMLGFAKKCYQGA